MWELNNVTFPFGRNPVADSYLLGCALPEAYDQSIDENGFPAYAHLDRSHRSVVTSDLDRVVVPMAMHFSAEETPNLPAGRE